MRSFSTLFSALDFKGYEELVLRRHPRADAVLIAPTGQSSTHDAGEWAILEQPGRDDRELGRDVTEKAAEGRKGDIPAL